MAQSLRLPLAPRLRGTRDVGGQLDPGMEISMIHTARRWLFGRLTRPEPHGCCCHCQALEVDDSDFGDFEVDPDMSVVREFGEGPGVAVPLCLLTVAFALAAMLAATGAALWAGRPGSMPCNSTTTA